MRKFALLVYITSLLISNSTFAQILNPAKWSWKAVSTGKGEYNLVFTATIDGKWHVYSQFLAEGGPVPTSLLFTANKDVQLIGKASETGARVHEGHDPVFDMELKYFEGSMTCVQKVKVLKDTKLKGTLEFMLCDDSRCLPPDDLEFEFDLKANVEKSGAEIKKDSSRSQNTIPVKPSDDQKTFDSAVQAVIEQNMSATDTAQQAQVVAQAGSDKKFGEPLSNCGKVSDAAKNKSLWSIILLGFLGGLIALITPCVFPMIPLTVSFFTKRNESKSKGRLDAILYSFSIVLIYFLISIPFLIFNISPDTLNEISTGAPLNVVFFIVFVIFAFSFFGFYEITLPSFIANKADSASHVGGFIGIFFMALTLAIVSFSCTGPIIGSLLVGALSSANGKLNLVAGMTSFGFALALPFGIFALFPSLMKSLPKSGGWLNSIKVVLGFVELIFAVKFLSNADLVAHWGILKREVFLGAWVILGGGLFLYLIGKLKFPHDSPVKKLSPLRLVSAAIALLFTVYSAYGIPGNELHLFSGFPPPKFYSIRDVKMVIEPIHNDYEAALRKAKAENKPLMIDFTGWACVNCRKMEENVWTDLEVLNRLNEKFVVVSLYVDDREKLPESEQRMSDFFKGKKIKTVGNKFSEMQAKYFGSNSQPFYVLVSPDEQLLNPPRGYTPDAKDYAAFLDCGLQSFKQLAATQQK